MVYPLEEWAVLENSIAPQTFILKAGKIFFFDKINMHEGRFVIVDKNNYEFFELDDCLGVIIQDGSMFSIQFTTNTIIKEWDYKGRNIKEFIINGVFYDLCKDNTGNYIFLGIRNERNIVEIYNSLGDSIASFYLNNILVGCGINVIDDCVYIGGLDNKNILKILKTNYLGVILEEWEIAKAPANQLIDKIIFYEEFIIALLKGDYDNIFMINTIDKTVNIVSPIALGLKNFFDVNVINESFYVLDGMKIYRLESDKFLFSRFVNGINPIRINPTLYAYQYMMYIKEINKNIISLFKPIVIGTVLIELINVIARIDKTGSDVWKMLILFDLLILLLGGVIKSICILRHKAERVDRLLEINRGIQTNWVPKNILQVVILINLSLCIIPSNIILLSIFLVALVTLMLALGYINIKVIENCKQDTIIELLYDDDPQYINYIKSVLLESRLKSNEKLIIKVLSHEKLCSKVALDWSISRRHILKQEVDVKGTNNQIIAIIDLSKRDIKYSRLSIIMDYVCFIKNKIKIYEVEIHGFNK